MAVYERPYDPLRPVVCIDEMNRQLVEERHIPCESGQPERVDSEYVRRGVMDVFMIAEPLAGKRDTVVTEKRTAVDFAHILQRTSDVLYPQAEKIVLVTDNLNTHTTASLYKAFPPEEARRLAERFEWHYTPKHGSWLDMAEIELSVLSRQALAKPNPMPKLSHVPSARGHLLGTLNAEKFNGNLPPQMPELGLLNSTPHIV